MNRDKVIWPDVLNYLFSILSGIDGEKDLLKVHGIITYLINDDCGRYRNHAEGVFDGEKVLQFNCQ